MQRKIIPSRTVRPPTGGARTSGRFKFNHGLVNTGALAIRTAITRKGDYFWKEFNASNTSVTIFPAFTNVGVLNQPGTNDIITTNVGNLLIPPATENFTNDLDGNLL